MRKPLALLVPLSVLLFAPIAGAVGAVGADAAWTIVLHPNDFVIGPALRALRTRHSWVAEFDGRTGAFEVALRKSTVPIPAPRCRTDYLILKIPFYDPENSQQASLGARRTVYDLLVGLQSRGTGSVTARVQAPAPIGQRGPRGFELTSCSLYFALPLAVHAERR